VQSARSMQPTAMAAADRLSWGASTRTHPPARSPHPRPPHPKSMYIAVHVRHTESVDVADHGLRW
jgi:hypothetical protein